jgi:hypothetical protein
MLRFAVNLSLASALSLACFGCNGVEPAATDEPVNETQDALKTSFTVDFSGCTEFAGVGVIPYAHARAAVPANYTLAGDTTNATAVVRVAECDDVIVAGADQGDGIVSQVGVGLVSPDGTGDINNYTVWYETTSLNLAIRLAAAGVNARYAPGLEYELASNGNGGGTLTVASAFDPSFKVTDIVVGPPVSTTPFLANWWGPHIEMATEVPLLHFGAAGNHATLTTPKFSALASLIGGSSLTFADLDSYNSFPTAHMVVSSTH